MNGNCSFDIKLRGVFSQSVNTHYFTVLRQKQQKSNRNLCQLHIGAHIQNTSLIWCLSTNPCTIQSDFWRLQNGHFHKHPEGTTGKFEGSGLRQKQKLKKGETLKRLNNPIGRLFFWCSALCRKSRTAARPEEEVLRGWRRQVGVEGINLGPGDR